MMAIFIWVLFCHYIADFVLQSHWMASNKSKNNVALLAHVSIYTLIMTASCAGVLMIDSVYELPTMNQLLVISYFAAITFGTHFATDYVTSRWSSKCFVLAMGSMIAEQNGMKLATKRRRPFSSGFVDVNTGECFHDFFVIIGFDQFIHHATLAATLILLGVV